MLCSTRNILWTLALVGALASLAVTNGARAWEDDEEEVPPVVRECSLWAREFNNKHPGEEWLQPFDCQECCTEEIVRGDFEDSPLGQEVLEGRCMCRLVGKKPTKKGTQQKQH